MELRHLRYFVALANAPTFTSAAERVHVTQSTLSHQIRQLEDELGAELFRRIGKKRVVLTDSGQLFLNYAARALSEVDSGRAVLRQSTFELSGELGIGAGNVFNLNFIPECVTRFMAKFPAVKVIVDELDAERIHAAIQSGELHVGITWAPRDLGDLSFEPLHAEEMVLVVGPSHPFRGRKKIRMAELHGQPLALMSHRFATRELLEGCFLSCGAKPVVVAEINSVSPLLKIISRTPIAAIVSRYAVLDRHDLHVVHLEGPTPTRTPGILWRADHRHLFAASFVSIVREVALDATMSLQPVAARGAG